MRRSVLTLFLLALTAANLSAETRVLRGHTGNGISAIAVSKDGRWIASASLDRSVRVWNAQTGMTTRVFAAHKNEVYSVAFSPDGREIASSDYDGSVLVWNAATGKVRLTLKLDGWSTAVAYSPDGSKLAVANQSPGSIIFDAKTGRQLMKIETRGYTNTAAFSPDGLTLVTAASGPGFWNLSNGKFEKGLRGHNGSVRSIAFSPDGKWLASAGSDKTARLWDVARGETVKIFETTTTIKNDYPEPFKWKLPITSVSFSPDAQTLATATGHSIHLWNISTGENFKVLEGHENTVTSIGFLPDGKRIVSGSMDNTVRLWDVGM